VTNLKKSLEGWRFGWALFSTALKASLALRGAFLLQASFMVFNNLIFFCMWWILMDRFGSIRGYTIADTLALLGVTVAGYGGAVVVCGGALELGRTINEGELDALLSQPKSVLLRAIASRSMASGWGDLASGVLMLGLSAHVHLSNLPAVLLAVVISAVTFVACCVMLHSSAFWLGRVDGATRMLLDFVITFSTYPPTLFGAGIKLVLFTVLPAGLIAYLPVQLVRDFDLRTALLAVSGSALYTWLACWVFARGLRRYESGSRFGVWG
jgi:ABC-2 type transport system permease protein